MNKKIIFIALISFMATSTMYPQESDVAVTTAAQSKNWYDSLTQGWQNFVDSIKQALGGSQVKEKFSEAAQKTKQAGTSAAQKVQEKASQAAQSAKETGEGAFEKVKNFFSGKNSTTTGTADQPQVQDAAEDVQNAQEQLKDKTQDLKTELQKLEEKAESTVEKTVSDIL